MAYCDARIAEASFAEDIKVTAETLILKFRRLGIISEGSVACIARTYRFSTRSTFASGSS